MDTHIHAASDTAVELSFKAVSRLGGKRIEIYFGAFGTWCSFGVLLVDSLQIGCYCSIGHYARCFHSINRCGGVVVLYSVGLQTQVVIIHIFEKFL